MSRRCAPVRTCGTPRSPSTTLCARRRPCRSTKRWDLSVGAEMPVSDSVIASTSARDVTTPEDPPRPAMIMRCAREMWDQRELTAWLRTTPTGLVVGVLVAGPVSLAAAARWPGRARRAVHHRWVHAGGPRGRLRCRRGATPPGGGAGRGSAAGTFRLHGSRRCDDRSSSRTARTRSGAGGRACCRRDRYSDGGRKRPVRAATPRPAVAAAGRWTRTHRCGRGTCGVDVGL
jgi:hypothetical protein